MNKRQFPHLSKSFNRGAFQIVLLYLLVGGLWILLSDKAAARIALNQEMLTVISLYKGWGYVLVTALLLYWLIQRDTAALRASEAQLQQVIDALPVLIAYVDRGGRYRFTNRTYEEWFGGPAQGKTLEEVTGPKAYQTISPYVDQALRGETVTYESALSYPLGERFINATYIPDKTTDGRVKGFFALVQDMTENKQTREELRQWADAFNGCAHGIAIGDPITNRIVVCNAAFANLHKCNVEDIVGSAILSVYAPTDYEYVRRNIEKADQIGRVRYEAQMVRKDGSTFPVQMDLVSVLGEEGKLLYRVATAQDITERKEAEANLRKSEERYRYLFDNNPYPMWLYDRKTLAFLDVNEAAVAKYGYSRQEFLNMSLVDIRPSEDIDRLMDNLAQERPPLEHSSDWRHRLKDGTIIHVEITSHTIEIDGHASVLVIAQDITARKQAEEQIKSLARFPDENPNPILRVTHEGKIIYANASSELLLKDWRRQVGDDLSPDWVALIKELSQAQTRKTIDIRCQDTIYSIIVTPIPGARYVNLYGTDITERKQVETALLESSLQFRTLFEASPDAILLIDPHGEWPIMDCNMVACEMNGYTRDELIGQPIDIMNPNPLPDSELDGYLEKIRKANVLRYEGLHRRKDGSTFPIEVSTSLVSLGGREVLLGIDRDITERKRIEKELQEARDDLERKVEERTSALSESNALLQALTDNIPDHIYFKDTQSRFIRSSKSQVSMLGLGDPAEIIGKTDFDFFPHAARSYAEEQAVMRTGDPLVDLEEWVVWPNGRETWVSTTKMPLQNSKGETIGIFGISHDITERKQAEQAIQQLNNDLEIQAAQLQSANQELESFSYSVSHDLRAPLRAIDGYTRILVEDYEAKLDEEGKRMCGIISAEARRMGQLIDDLLAFSRLGRKAMYTSKIDMKALAASIFNELIRGENQERIDFQLTKLPSVQADPSLIRQVWTNLLSNAIKFTSRKERAVIRVGTRQSKDEYIYYVRDTGAGFDMEYVDKLFGVFQRLHGESEFEGTGVGLAIVQRIIRRHGGRVWAEGEPEKGATFYFSLPRQEAPDGS